jgi:hypothetical protein
MTVPNATQTDIEQVLKDGARLLYTVAAGQFFELGDINAWFERFNALHVQDDTYGAIGARSNDADPLIDQAEGVLAELVVRATQARDDFATAVANVRTPS